MAERIFRNPFPREPIVPQRRDGTRAELDGEETFNAPWPTQPQPITAAEAEAQFHEEMDRAARRRGFIPQPPGETRYREPTVTTYTAGDTITIPAGAPTPAAEPPAPERRLVTHNEIAILARRIAGYCAFQIEAEAIRLLKREIDVLLERRNMAPVLSVAQFVDRVRWSLPPGVAFSDQPTAEELRPILRFFFYRARIDTDPVLYTNARGVGRTRDVAAVVLGAGARTPADDERDTPHVPEPRAPHAVYIDGFATLEAEVENARLAEEQEQRIRNAAIANEPRCDFYFVSYGTITSGAIWTLRNDGDSPAIFIHDIRTNRVYFMSRTPAYNSFDSEVELRSHNESLQFLYLEAGRRYDMQLGRTNGMFRPWASLEWVHGGGPEVRHLRNTIIGPFLNNQHT